MGKPNLMVVETTPGKFLLPECRNVTCRRYLNDLARLVIIIIIKKILIISLISREHNSALIMESASSCSHKKCIRSASAPVQTKVYFSVRGLGGATLR